MTIKSFVCQNYETAIFASQNNKNLYTNKITKGLIMDNLFITRIRNLNNLLISTHCFSPQVRNDENCWFNLNIIRISVFICNITTRRLFCLVFHTQQRRGLVPVNLCFLYILKHEKKISTSPFFPLIMHFLPAGLTV